MSIKNRGYLLEASKMFDYKYPTSRRQELLDIIAKKFPF
jgi:hypothetical protein